MRRIHKSADPAAFRAWRLALRPRGSIPPWDEFPDPPRSPVRTQLAADQFHICCYCAGTIARGNFHIEHFRPRHFFPEQTYRWQNLLASCETSHPGLDDVIELQKHCGDAKDNWFTLGVTVSPLETGVDSLFRYTLQGKVFPAKTLRTRKAAVQTTIDKLNLNAPFLVARRAKILGRAAEDSTVMTRDAWTATYLGANADGILQEFVPALRYNYDKHWSPRFL